MDKPAAPGMMVGKRQEAGEGTAVSESDARSRAAQLARASGLSGAVKRCTGCPAPRAWRPVEDFSVASGRPDGRQSQCRACARAYHAHYAARRRQPRPAAPRRPLRPLAPRPLWALECILCGGYEEADHRSPVSLWCWRDRSRLVVSVLRLVRARRPSVWGLA